MCYFLLNQYKIPFDVKMKINCKIVSVPTRKRPS